MVAKEGGYYRVSFMGTRGVTQGDPLSPTIFNMVVGEGVRHWVTVTADSAEDRSRRRQEVRHQNNLLYHDDIVTSSDLRCLQGDLSTSVGLFDRVGLKNSFGNTVGMV